MRKTALGLAMVCLFIGIVGCPPMETPPTGDGNGDGQTDLEAGQAVYTESCALCHSLGAFDTEGFAGDLQGQSAAITIEFVNAHIAPTELTQPQVDNLQLFVASQ